MAGLTPDGVLVVDKPIGPTSHDIVARARRLYGTRSVGHAGTLDPMASGVLLLLFGEAKKLSLYLTAEDKTYVGEVCFGTSTDSLDATGRVTDRLELDREFCSKTELEQALDQERRRTLQEPPQVSAIKVLGRPSHRRLRAGEAPVLASRSVRVESLELLSTGDRCATLRLKVSKGYYVRALARDLGAALGVPAHLAVLRRLASGPWSLRQAVAWPPPGVPALIPTRDAALTCLPSSQLNADGTLRCRQGKLLDAKDFLDPPTPEQLGVRAWLGPEGDLVALGQQVAPGNHRVVRGFRGEPH